MAATSFVTGYRVVMPKMVTLKASQVHARTGFMQEVWPIW